MNNENLIDLLRPLAIDSFTSSFESLMGATTNLQHAESTDVVFYRYEPSDKNEALFKKRIAGKKIGCLVSNNIPSFYKGNWIKINNCNFLKAQKLVVETLYPFDENKLKIIGVTGTNGKTTVVNFIKQVCTSQDLSVATIGTLGLEHSHQNISEDFGATTPSFLDLRRLISKFYLNTDVLAIEVSSHALKQKRLYDLKLDAAIWTSFSQDHLDYHKDMDDYFNSKLLIIKNLKGQGKLFVSQREKELSENLIKRCKNQLKLVETLQENFYHGLPLIFKADYNRANFEVALSAFEFCTEKIKVDPERFKKFVGAAGRFYIREYEGRYFIVDYAHTPAALKNICCSIKKSWPQKKLLTIFGCGGDRDKTKRPLMGAVASKNSDGVIVTSDNPRSETPEDIIDQILEGVEKNHKVRVELDRLNAIMMGLNDKNFDIVLIAGKGHEEYQEIRGKKIGFSDIKTVEKWMD